MWRKRDLIPPDVVKNANPAPLDYAVPLACAEDPSSILLGAGEFAVPNEPISCSISIRSLQGASQTTLVASVDGEALVVRKVANFSLDGFTIRMPSVGVSWCECRATGDIEFSNLVWDSSTTSGLLFPEGDDTINPVWASSLRLNNISASDVVLQADALILLRKPIFFVAASGFTVTDSSLSRILSFDPGFCSVLYGSLCREQLGGERH